MSKRPRRRRVPSPEGEGGPETKRSKGAPAPNVIWEWEGDGGKWTAYSSDHSKALTDGLSQGEKDVVLQVAPSVKMRVRFESMTQANVTTGWQRNIRCVSTSPSSSSSSSSLSLSSSEAVWEWENEKGTWAAYSPTVQRLLTACHLCGVESVKVEGTGRKRYTVDLKTMKQTGQRGGQERAVRQRHAAAWQWQNEHGQWMNYDPTIAMELEKEHSKPSAGGKVSLTAAGRAYTVDVAKMEQTNDATGVVRKVRRMKTAATSSDATPTTSKKATPTTTSEVTPTTSDDTVSPSTSTEEKKESTDGTGLVIRKYQGKVPVDYVCSQKVGKAHVYSEDEEVWDAMLNQTNLKNNNNKFYILQLLKDNTAARYSTWFRWGRVGKTGQHMLTECGSDLEKAKELFRKKFSDKTLNEWEDRASFVKQAGKYDLLQMDYAAIEETDVGVEEEEEEEEGEEAVEKKPLESKLDKRLQALIELICDVKAMEDAVVEMKYDTKKAPLGKLTKDQIHSGYAALKAIDDCISRGQFGDPLIKACDQFYTRVPHDFGMRRPPIIRTKEEVKEKLALLEALGDIEIAMKVLREGDKSEHPVDRHYHGLQCKLETVDEEEEIFQIIEKYVRQTHAKTHNQYTLTVADVFKMEKEDEKESFKDVGNRHLLWHGSRLTNWVSILSQGLRVAPPEAPVTGYMFGKGVYFADMCSKSANYCFASPSRKEGLLVLCDVALGQTNDLLAADYSADKLPRGKHSTRGLGRVAPDPAQQETLPDGCVVPLGTSINTSVHNPHGYTLNYNEFVVYDTKQIKMRYLVKVQFNFV